MRRVNFGWQEIEGYIFPEPENEVEDDDMLEEVENLDRLMSEPEVRENFCKYCFENRDLEVRTFQEWLRYSFEDEEEVESSVGKFKDVVLQSVALGSEVFLRKEYF